MTLQASILLLVNEVWVSSEVLLSNKLSWLLVLGPIALIGDYLGFLGEAACFALSGIALIPCAERLSFVTEQVAEHTNGTIGALLNATFGNAPELLIATAALRSGYYRVVQLAMLGSMLTNLLLVFGMSCLVGGIRWQVQEIRITSGNVSVGMLLLSVAGSLLPAALILAGQLDDGHPDGTGSSSSQTKDNNHNNNNSNNNNNHSTIGQHVPTFEEIQYSRVNAVIMIFMYGCYLIFQLGTHKDEFDDEENIVESADGHQLHMTPHFTSRHGRQKKSQRNLFCMNLIQRVSSSRIFSFVPTVRRGGGNDVEMITRAHNSNDNLAAPYDDDDEDGSGGGLMESDDNASQNSDEAGGKLLPQNSRLNISRSSSGESGYFDEYGDMSTSTSRNREMESPTRRNGGGSRGVINGSGLLQAGRLIPLGLVDPSESLDISYHDAPQMSFRVGIVWLFIITLCISAMSDILVDTIDGFASRAHLSEVFTTMVIVPFFSNVAEQVSAILFAYRNEMDLCVGVTVGSAIQVMTMVLPGCVLIGLFVDRSMTLYFHAYETACLFLAVIVVAAVLQGGTTNWLVGTTLIGIYIMMATGFWFHTHEELAVDAESND